MWLDLGSYEVRVPVLERRDEKRADGATVTTWVEVGVKIAQVSIMVNVAALVKTLGRTAANSKSGKSVEASGAVVAKVMTSREERKDAPSCGKAAELRGDEFETGSDGMAQVRS